MKAFRFTQIEKKNIYNKDEITKPECCALIKHKVAHSDQNATMIVLKIYFKIVKILRACAFKVVHEK